MITQSWGAEMIYGDLGIRKQGGQHCFSCRLRVALAIGFAILIVTVSAMALGSENELYHWRELCRLDNGEACAQLAHALLERPDQERYQSEAGQAYDKACAFNIIWACNNIADQYFYGKFGRSRDLRKAIRYFEIGCKVKNMYACSRLLEIANDIDQSKPLH